jgi:fatty-acyl-CoA synthase
MGGVTDYAIAPIVEAVAARVPDRPAVVRGDVVRSYAEFTDRCRRLARYLADRGLGCDQERPELAGHEVGQDLLAQYLYNSHEYLEGLVGGYRARVAPFNVNYRYVADELRYLLRDARPRAVQYHAGFAPLLAEVLADLPKDGAPEIEVLLQVDDGSGHPLLPGAVDYEQALASVPPEVDTEPSPDDLYVLYTGGTTGMPKGVLWRQADALVALLGFRNRRTGREWGSLDERLAVISETPQRVMPLAPYMHGAAQWGALQALIEGSTVVVADSGRFDPAETVDAVARHGVTVVTMVGDAFGRPLADELEARPRPLPSLRLLLSGGAALGPGYKRRLIEAVPGLNVVETIGSSETGVQGRLTGDGSAPPGAGAGSAGGRAAFAREGSALVISADRTQVLEPGHEGTGWLATRGRVPLGYFGDPDRTARTFPVVDGVRLSVPGDRARLLSDDRVEMLGRDSVTINSGGEKVFAEEVEEAVKAHPDVVDAVVCGRPSERWGAEVVALVALSPTAALRPGTAAESDLVAFCADRIARYKLPKAVVFVDEVPRSPSGKADYKWAVSVARAHP